jgi:hypothetical protein
MIDEWMFEINIYENLFYRIHLNFVPKKRRKGFIQIEFEVIKCLLNKIELESLNQGFK